jgi:hypothetical protein
MAGNVLCPVWDDPEGISGAKRATRKGSAVERRGNPEGISGISDTEHEFFTSFPSVLE